MNAVEYMIPGILMAFLPRLLETIAIRDVMDIVAIRKYQKQVYYIAWYPLFVVWIYVVSMLSVPNILKLVLNIAFSFIAMVALYAGKWYRLFLIAATVMIGNRLFDLLFVFGFSWISGENYGSMSPQDVRLFCMILLTKLTEMLTAKIFRGIAGHRRISDLKREDHFIYFLIPVISILIADCLMLDCIRQGTVSINLAGAISGIIILDIAFFYMIHRMEFYYKSESDLRALNLHMAAQMESIAAVEQTHKKIRQISHGITTQLSAIETLLRHQKYQEAEEYLRSITDTVEQDILPIHTNNVVVDALLNQRYIMARSKNIKMQFDIQDLQDIRLRTTDMVSILSNALNNAIEACEKVTGNRLIELKIINNDHELFISVQNTVEEDIQIAGDTLPTSKMDKLNHGLGLGGIKSVVDRCGGKLFIECENRIFKLVAAFITTLD